MTSIDRRKLFSLGLASAGLSFAPAWLRRGFGSDPGPHEPQDPDSPQDPQDPAAARKAQFAKATQRARLHRKPLLVMIVPEDYRAAWLRGRWLGAFLNHGGSLATMELALTVPACLKASELRELTGAQVDGNPVMVLVDAREGRAPGPAPRATPIAFEFGSMEGVAVDGESWEDQQRRQLEEIESRLELLGNELIKAMHRHGCNLATMAAEAKKAIGSEELRSVEAWLGAESAEDRPDDELLVRAAAIVRRTAARQPEERRRQSLDALVEAVQASVVQQRIAGARWMVPGGCGQKPERPTEQEQKDTMRIACGMAHTPPLCDRFLSFYAVP